MEAQWSDPEFLGAVFAQTEIIRKPLIGVISGYHVLPYILVAPEHERPSHAVEVRGRIKVSPRLVIAAGGDGPTAGTGGAAGWHTRYGVWSPWARGSRSRWRPCSC